MDNGQFAWLQINATSNHTRVPPRSTDTLTLDTFLTSAGNLATLFFGTRWIWSTFFGTQLGECIFKHLWNECIMWITKFMMPPSLAIYFNHLSDKIPYPVSCTIDQLKGLDEFIKIFCSHRVLTDSRKWYSIIVTYVALTRAWTG